jgi:hypothetical protein
MVTEVGGGAVAEAGVISQQPKRVVAGVTEQGTHDPCPVAMIDSQRLPFRRVATDGAQAALSRMERSERVRRNAVPLGFAAPRLALLAPMLSPLRFVRLVVGATKVLKVGRVAITVPAQPLGVVLPLGMAVIDALESLRAPATVISHPPI